MEKYTESDYRFTKLDKAVKFLSALMIDDDISRNIVSKEESLENDYIKASEHEARVRIMEAHDHIYQWGDIRIVYEKAQ